MGQHINSSHDLTRIRKHMHGTFPQGMRQGCVGDDENVGVHGVTVALSPARLMKWTKAIALSKP